MGRRSSRCWLFVVLYFGVQISTRVQLDAGAWSRSAVVLAFFIKVIIELGGDNDSAKAFDPNSSTTGSSGILFGVLYGVLIFVGFETAANLAEETAEPKRAIPAAVLTSVVVVSIFYVIAAYAQVAGFGFDMAVITSPEVAGAPLFALGAPEAGGTDRRSSSKLLVSSCSSTCSRSTWVRRRLDPRCVRDGSRPAACRRPGLRVERSTARRPGAIVF